MVHVEIAWLMWRLHGLFKDVMTQVAYGDGLAACSSEFQS